MSDDKKIIIDEDWKSQVENERESLDAKEEPGEKETSANDPPMPPASLEMLLTTLATEAMMALGQMPHPVTGEVAHLPNQAKYLIDTIEVLQEKTKGNISAAEDGAITNLLHQLRMAFVAGPPASQQEAAQPEVSKIEIPGQG